MDWFIDIFTEQTFVQATLVLALICAVGLALGQIKIKGISLGVTFVFFAGIIAGHFGLKVNQDMLTMLQNFLQKLLLVKVKYSKLKLWKKENQLIELKVS